MVLTLDLMLSILLRFEENTNDVCKLSCQEVFSAKKCSVVLNGIFCAIITKIMMSMI